MAVTKKRNTASKSSKRRIITRDSLNRALVKDKLGLLKCSYCEKKFKDGFAIKRHERVHTGEKPFQCTICHTAFTQKSSRDFHMRNINCRNRPLKKSSPKKSSNNKSTISKKKAIPSENKTMQDTVNGVAMSYLYKCPFCSKFYDSCNSRKNHVLEIHTQGKPHSCSMCGQTFVNLTVLRQHALTHSENESNYL